MSSLATNPVVQMVRAASFAAEKHRDQRRKSDDSPYINHPLGVAWILCHEGRITDEVTLQAAILHDTVEDTQTTIAELEMIFGIEVASVVREVTDNKSLPKVERKKLQIEHASHVSDRAKIIKLADKLHNYRDLCSLPPPGWSLDQIQGYFVWGSFVTRAAAGANPALDAILERFYTGFFLFKGKTYPILPSGDLTVALEHYYTVIDGQP